MADGASIGEVFVECSPRATAFWQKFQQQAGPGASRAGEQLGAAVGKGIQDRIAKGMVDGIQSGGRSAQASAAKAGEESGGKFADTFKRRVEAALKSLPKATVDADTSPAERRIAEIRARLEALSGAKVGVDVDAGAASAEVAALSAELRDLGAQSPNVQVRADTAAAAGQLAAFGAEVDRLDGRQVDVQVDADTAGAQAQLAAVGGAATGSISGIQALIAAGIAIAPAIVPAAAAAVAALGAIGPAAAVGGAGIGVLALGIVPVIGAVKAMGAAHDAAGKSAVSSAGKQGQMAAAIDGVRSAQASLANTTANAAEANRRAEQRVTDAVRSETTAQQALLRAQQAINGAREDARRSLEDMANRQADLALDQRKSALDITKAEQDLAKAKAAAAKSPTATNQRAVAEAQLALDEQIQRSKELSTEQKRLAADKAEADRKGVDGSKQVVAAQDAITAAQGKLRASQQAVADAKHQQDETARQGAFSVAQAQQGVITAQRGVQSASVSAGTAGSAAMTKLQQAMAGLSPAGQTFAKFLFGLKDQFTGLSKTAQEGLLPGLQSFLTDLLPVMPQVNTLVGILAQTMGDLFRQAGPVIAEILPPFLTMLGRVGPPIMEAFATILLNIGKGFGGIIEAFAPFAVQFFQGLADLSTKFADFGTGLATNPGFQAFIDYVTTNGPTLVGLLGDLVVVAIKLLIGFAPLGEMLLKGAAAVAGFLAALPPGVLLGIAYAIGLIVVAVAAIVGGPITAAVAVITLFAAAWVYAYTKVQWFHDLVNAYVAAIVAVVTWLWNTAVAVFNGISTAIQTAWAFISPILSAIGTVLSAVLGPIFMGLWAVVKFVLSMVATQFQIVWAAVQIVFGLIQIGLILLGRAFMDWFNDHVKPVWDAVATIVEYVWTNKVQPILSALGGYIRDHVAPAFRLGVEAIGIAWELLKDKARQPVAFVVNQIVNPLIRGYNDLAGTFGVNKVDEIKGFAYGGFVSGPGGPRDDQVFAMLSNGEYVIPAHIVRQLGVGFFDQLIGQPTARYPGDGSQGLAFADGGIVGFFKDVWNGLTDPIGLLKRPAEAMLNAIPGGPGIKNLLTGMGHKLIDGLIGFLNGGGNETGNLAKTRAFIQSQVGKPYVWASAGPGGYDCSGLLSAAWLTAHGKSPYSHIFSTSNEAGFFPKGGKGPFTAGWTNPGEPGPGGSSVGHTAGVLFPGTKLAFPFESTGGVGVRAGSGVTNVDSFAHVGHFRDGGLIRMGTYDSGGQLPPGLTLAYNGTGSPETIRTADQEAALRRGGATITQHIYPQRGQSEPEIAAAASRQLAWDLK